MTEERRRIGQIIAAVTVLFRTARRRQRRIFRLLTARRPRRDRDKTPQRARAGTLVSLPARLFP